MRSLMLGIAAAAHVHGSARRPGKHAGRADESRMVRCRCRDARAEARRGRSAHQGARGRRESGGLETARGARRAGAGHGCRRAPSIHWVRASRGWKVGEPVLGFARQSGSYAEYAVIPVNSLARKPKSMTFEQAAGVPIAAETAYRALHEAGKIAARPDRAHPRRARVAWVPPPCRSPRRPARASSAPLRLTISISCKSIGVDQVIDYKARNSKTW